MNISFTRFHFLAIVSLVLVWAVALTCRDSVYDNIRQYFSESNKPKTSQTMTGVMIKDKVAVITDTQFNSRTLPLILHFHAVLGPSWPILFYTSPETYREHFSLNATSKTGTSAVWRRAVEQREIEVRIIDKQFDLTQRQGVNLYLSKPWFWNQLAPAKSVLIFQTDAMLCANSRKTMDDFLKYDFIGAVFDPKKHLYNGGLSLRNRTMTLEILNSGRDWEKEVKAGKWDSKAGEDVWFSAIMDKRGGKMPPVAEALDFSHEFEWQVDGDHKPLGYHKVHKFASKKMDKIRAWCPEIDLAAPGKLADDPRR